MSYDDAKERVRQATDIVELVGKHLELRRAGRGYVARCPWHDDRKPSLNVNPERQTWRCWVCDIGGDVFSFAMKRENCDFRQALEMLAERAGIELSRQPQRKAEPGSPDDKNTLYRCCDWAAKQFQEFLLRGEAAETARRYVEDRAITPDSVETFGVGFAPLENAWLLNRAKNTPFTPAVLEAAGLVSKFEDSGNYRDFFRGRLIFPIRDLQSRAIGFGGRILPEFATDRTGKYFNPRETRLYSKSETLYALEIARNHSARSRHLIIVEGYTDVILCHQHGVQEAIACCGTAITDGHIRQLKRFADTIYLVLDGDAAGQRRTNELLELFVASQVDLRILSLPDELDPAEFMLERGGNAFRELLSTAVDALEHKIRGATHGIDLARETHRANQALEEILRTIAAGLPPGTIDAAGLRTQQLVSRLARQFMLDEADVRQRFNQLRRTVKGRASAPVTAETSAEDRPTSHSLPQLEPCEAEVLEILVVHPELAPTALAELSDDDMRTPPARLIFQAYRQLEEAGMPLDFGPVLAEIEDPALKSLLVAIDEQAGERIERQSRRKEAAVDPPTRLRDTIRFFHRAHADRERRQLETHLEQKLIPAEQETDVFQQIVNAKRQQLGIIAPTEG